MGLQKMGLQLIKKDTYTPVSTAALFIVAKTWKQSKWPSTDEWLSNILLCVYIYTLTHTHIYTHTHTYIYTAHLLHTFLVLL